SNLAGVFRARVRRLLGQLVRPYRRPILGAAALILLKTAATLAIPYLVGLAIDQGVRPGRTGDLNRLLALVVVLGCVMSVAAVAIPLIVVLTQWFRGQSALSYRAVRTAIALVIVHYTESLAGIRAVQAFRRESRNQEIFVDVVGRYRDANVWSNTLGATFGPGI